MTSSVSEFKLRPLPYLDSKWLRADLQSALRSNDDLSILWNNLVKDNELVTNPTSNTTIINSAGNVAYMQCYGRFYCGVEKLTCNCCTGYCRPTSECSCASCRKHETEEHTNKRGSTANDLLNENINSSDLMLDKWLWSPVPSKRKTFFLYFFFLLNKFFSDFFCIPNIA